MRMMLMVGLALSVAAAFASPESDLEAKIPAIIKASAAHYEKLAAAAEAETEAAAHPRFPRNFGDGKVGYIDDVDWTSGFFPGSLWYLYEATGENRWLGLAHRWTDRLVGVKDYIDNHDIGFMLYCSAGNGLRLTGDVMYEGWLHSAARCLRERFNEKVGTIRSWDSWGENFGFFGMHHITIVDNLMNLELLLWDSRYTYSVDGAWWSGQVAIKHADTTMKHHFRPDGSAYHILDYNPEDGTVAGIRAGQGANVEGTWARGQAWAVYGYTMLYRETDYVRYLDQAVKAADYVLAAPTPEDGIPYWDYKAVGIPDEPRDSSAAAVLASAMIELSQYVGPGKAKSYRAWAVKALNSLAGAGYFAKPGENGEFLLKHGTGVKPFGLEIDTPLNYGDYYFLEALLRFRNLKAREAECAEVAKLLPPKAALPEEEEALRFHGTHGIAMDNVDAVTMADKLLTEPIPEITDELYGDYWKTGIRATYEETYFRRLNQLLVLVRAERKTANGKYLKRIDDYIRAICAMKSWVLPAHDWSEGGMGTFKGLAITTDLVSTEVGAELACVVQLLGDRLDPKTVGLVRENVERRVFGPVRRELAVRLFPETAIGARPYGWNQDSFWHLWWMNGGNNWNAVCWDNVVCAACGLLEDPRERAYFAVAARKAADIYLKHGFTDDGYCSEGMGYWNYGYGHHLQTGRLLKRLTEGKYDFFSNPKDKLAAAYARAYTLASGESPAFADGNGAVDPVYQNLVDAFWPDLPKDLPAASEFPAGQVWLFRDPAGLSVAFKGGNNNELHNHNDLGSYYVVAGGRFVAGDPGGEVYTRRTFSPERYESKVLNSYGHPVPVVGGKLQSTGGEFAAKVVEKKSADGVETVTLDLTGAYEVKALKRLTRTFVYDRKAKAFTVTDRVSFSAPTEFEDCYVTFGDPVNVKVSAAKGGKLVAAKEELIDNPGKPTPHRFRYRFARKVTEAEVEFKFGK